MANTTAQTTAPTNTTPDDEEDDTTPATHVIKRIVVAPKTYGDAQEIEVPKSAEVFEAAFMAGQILMWAKCEIEDEDETRRYKVISDGDGFVGDDITIIATAVRPNGIAMHVVELG